MTMHPKVRLATIEAAKVMTKETDWHITPNEVSQIMGDNATKNILYVAQKGDVTILCNKFPNGELHVKVVKW